MHLPNSPTIYVVLNKIEFIWKAQAIFYWASCSQDLQQFRHLHIQKMFAELQWVDVVKNNISYYIDNTGNKHNILSHSELYHF